MSLSHQVSEDIIRQQCIKPLINNEEIKEDPLECVCMLLKIIGSALRMGPLELGWKGWGVLILFCMCY